MEMRSASRAPYPAYNYVEILTGRDGSDILRMGQLLSCPALKRVSRGFRSSKMSIDIGSTVEGTVVKLAEYGAIVRLQGGKTGLIHISEIADTFVHDVREHFKEHDRVIVRVLSVNNKGRYELSTKNIEQPEQEPVVPREKPKPAEREREIIDLGPESVEHSSASPFHVGFEDRLQRYMKDSQDRLSDIKRNIECKRGNKKRR